MGTPEFPDLGKHCSVDDCKLIDFLPFNCDRCTKVFCLQHRSYTTHKCPNANQESATVVVCPLCAKGVRLVPDQDPNLTWDVHVNTDCDPSNYEKATKKKRCPVPGCKEILTFSNKIRCRDCTQEHCLKHRFGADHKCPGPKGTDSGFPFLGRLSRSQKGSLIRPNSASSSGGSLWWNSSLLTAASSFKATAESGLQRLSTATNAALQKAKDGMSQSTTSSSNGDHVEQCLQCPAKFSSVTLLIEHVEKVHEEGGYRQRATVDVCPNCRKAFSDPVLLVDHVEKEHRGSVDF